LVSNVYRHFFDTALYNFVRKEHAIQLYDCTFTSQVPDMYLCCWQDKELRNIMSLNVLRLQANDLTRCFYNPDVPLACPVYALAFSRSHQVAVICSDFDPSFLGVLTQDGGISHWV